MLDSARLSRSIMVILPMALRASASTTHEPTPPTPTTQTCAARKRASPCAPYRRAMPPKRRSKSIPVSFNAISDITVIVPVLHTANLYHRAVCFILRLYRLEQIFASDAQPHGDGGSDEHRRINAE